jgi:hypothetical protein
MSRHDRSCTSSREKNCSPHASQLPTAARQGETRAQGAAGGLWQLGTKAPGARLGGREVEREVMG